MATVESLVKMINARIKSIYDYFTETSIEYMKAKSILFSYYGEFDFLIRESNDQPIGLIRGKKALELYYSRPDELQEVWQKLQEYGTVKQLASHYEIQEDEYSPSESVGVNYKDTEIRDLIREETERAYNAEYSDDDLYEKLRDEITEQAMIPREERDADYWIALNTAYDMLHVRGMGIEQKVSRAWGIFNEARIAHEEWLREHSAETDQEFELGGNY